MSQSLQDQDLWTVPLLAPPTGISPKFHQQSALTGVTIGVVVVVFVLMTATLSLRFWTKYKSREPWYLDDSFTIATFALTLTGGILQYVVTVHLAFEAWDIPISLMMTSWTHNILRSAVCITVLMLFFGKCCILAFYHRMFSHITTVRYQITFAVIMAGILLPVWVEGMWRAGAVLQASHTANLTLALGIIKLVLDLVIVYIPIPVVVGMNLSRAKKVGVLVTFGTGGIAIVADVIDVYFRVKVYRGKSPFINGVYVGLCGLVEAGISVIVASMPAAAKAWKRHVMTSSLYKMFLAKPSRSALHTSHQLPPDLRAAKAEAQKKRRWGLYSIPSLFTSHRSAAQSGPRTRADGTGARSEMTMVREFRQSLESKFASLDGSGLELRDPADCDAGGSNV